MFPFFNRLYLWTVFYFRIQEDAMIYIGMVSLFMYTVVYFLLLVGYVESRRLGDSRKWLLAVCEMRWRTAWEIRNWYLFVHGDWDGTLFGFRIFTPWKEIARDDKAKHKKTPCKWYAYFFSPLIYEHLKELEKNAYIKKRYVHPRNKVTRTLFRLPPKWLKPYIQWAKPFFLRKEYCLGARGAILLYGESYSPPSVFPPIEGRGVLLLQ